MQRPHTDLASVGVIAGSGTYRLPKSMVKATLEVETPYGKPSAPITLAEIAGRPVAFLPRHGNGHALPPQRINYRANVWALKSLGIHAILSASAVGGLHKGYAPETFVVTDQLIDRTWGRSDTFFDGTTSDKEQTPGVHHLPASEPFCPELRSHLTTALAVQRAAYVGRGTVVVVNGPRFSTKAESAWYAAAGADIISMTQYPEPVLAAELNMGVANLAFITDSDTGHDGTNPVTADVVFARMKNAEKTILNVLEAAIATISPGYVPRPLMNQDAVNRIMALPCVSTSRTADSE